MLGPKFQHAETLYEGSEEGNLMTRESIQVGGTQATVIHHLQAYSSGFKPFKSLHATLDGPNPQKKQRNKS